MFWIYIIWTFLNLIYLIIKNNSKFNKWIIKFDKLLILDWIIFTLWSTWTILLFNLIESYKVWLILSSVYFFNVLLFYFIFKEKNIKYKLFFSIIIIIWIVIMKLF